MFLLNDRPREEVIKRIEEKILGREGRREERERDCN